MLGFVYGLLLFEKRLLLGGQKGSGVTAYERQWEQ